MDKRCRICKRIIPDGVYCIRCEQIVADAEAEINEEETEE